MKIRYNRKRSINASTDKDYASLKGTDFKKAKAILEKDGFKEHEYGDKDNNNGYAVYRKGDKEVELTYKWEKGTRKDQYNAGKVLDVYVDEDINGACGMKSVKASNEGRSDLIYVIMVNGDPVAKGSYDAMVKKSYTYNYPVQMLKFPKAKLNSLIKMAKDAHRPDPLKFAVNRFINDNTSEYDSLNASTNRNNVTASTKPSYRSGEEAIRNACNVINVFFAGKEPDMWDDLYNDTNTKYFVDQHKDRSGGIDTESVVQEWRETYDEEYDPRDYLFNILRDQLGYSYDEAERMLIYASTRRRPVRASMSHKRKPIMAGAGAGYTIEWELDAIRRVNSFDVTDVDIDEFGLATVRADCDVDIEVTIKSAWSYMYGFNHPISDVPAKLLQIEFELALDEWNEYLRSEDYENGYQDQLLIDEAKNAVFQINEMEAFNILEDAAWEVLQGDSYSYGGGWSHSTWDGTICELDEYHYVTIQVIDQMVIDYVDRAVTNDNIVTEYWIDFYLFRDEYFDTEQDARDAAINAYNSGELEDDVDIMKNEWEEILLNIEGETDLDNLYTEKVGTLYADDYISPNEDEEY